MTDTIELRSLGGLLEASCPRTSLSPKLPKAIVVGGRVYTATLVDGIFKRIEDSINFDAIAQEGRGPYGGPFFWEVSRAPVGVKI